MFGTEQAAEADDVDAAEAALAAGAREFPSNLHQTSFLKTFSQFLVTNVLQMAQRTYPFHPKLTLG